MTNQHQPVHSKVAVSNTSVSDLPARPRDQRVKVSPNKPLKHGFKFPAPAFSMNWVRENGYFYQQQVEQIIGSQVSVRDQGRMLMMSSYSYLGLLNHPRINHAAAEAIKQFGTGTLGARLLAGTTPVHLALEERLAALKGTEAAVTFSSGFSTNLSTIPALAGRQDYVFCDKLNHASIIDACALAGATMRRFRHNDADDLARQLASIPADANKLVVVDAVFSMDGDIADLPNLSSVCRCYGALLMVDEAHSFGVIGMTGTGIEEHFGLPPDTIDIKMGTLSKAIPSYGGFIAASRAVVDLLKHRGRGFIFSSALPAYSAAAALESLNVIRDEQWRITRLQENTRYFLRLMHGHGLNTLCSQTPIVPAIMGDSELGHRCAQYCQERGIFIQSIPHPVVPRGTARLRCIVTTDHSFEDLCLCADTIAEAVAAQREGMTGTVVPGMAYQAGPVNTAVAKESTGIRSEA